MFSTLFGLNFLYFCFDTFVIYGWSSTDLSEFTDRFFYFIYSLEQLKYIISFSYCILQLRDFI